MLEDQPYQCPCCDYYSLAERNSYLICAVCYWEDDGHDLDRPDVESGANHITLRTARRNFITLGASDHAALSFVLSPSERTGLRREQRATF